MSKWKAGVRSRRDLAHLAPLATSRPLPSGERERGGVSFFQKGGLSLTKPWSECIVDQVRFRIYRNILIGTGERGNGNWTSSEDDLAGVRMETDQHVPHGTHHQLGRLPAMSHIQPSEPVQSCSNITQNLERERERVCLHVNCSFLNQFLTPDNRA